MIAIDLDSATEDRLERLARKTGRSKTACAQELIVEYLAEFEDLEVAEDRLKHPGKTYSADEVKRELGLDLTNVH
jgi:RHH-type rel operon transcriptional repressor/antitoxin RelB